MPITNNARVLNYLPYAIGSYGSGPNTTGKIVGNAIPVTVERFVPTPENGFQGTLYKDTATGKYTVAFAGTNDEIDVLHPDRQLATGNALTGIGAGAWDSQFSDAIKFTYEAFKQIQTEYKEATGRTLSLDQIRNQVEVTGHSLGGSLAETTSKFFGLSGSNIDGPGVQAVVKQSQFAALQSQVQESFPDLNTNYTLTPSQFGAYAYTTVGAAGTHLDGIEVQYKPAAVVAEVGMAFAGVSTLTLSPGGVLLGTALVGTTAQWHPSGLILLEAEADAGLTPTGTLPISPIGLTGLLEHAAPSQVGSNLPVGAKVSTTLNALQMQADVNFVQGNVVQGLSPSGVPLDGTQKPIGPFNVTASKDPETGRIVEVYAPVDSNGMSVGTGFIREFVLDSAGRVGAVDGDGNVTFVMVGSSGDGAAVVTVTTGGQINLQSNMGDVSSLGSVPPEAAQQLGQGKGDLKTVIEQSDVGRRWFDGAQDYDKPVTVDPNNPVGLRLVQVDGNTYIVGPNGTLDRVIPGHPGYVESRDSTGGGVILDANGHAVAVLQPGDQVLSTDTYGVAIYNDAGHAVDRSTEDAHPGVFVASDQSQPVADGSDAHFQNHPPVTGPQTPVVEQSPDPSDAHFTRYPAASEASTPNQPTSPLAPADTGYTTPVLVATGSIPTEPPITPADPSAPDPHDAHFTNHANDYQAALLNAQVTDAGTALTFASSLIGLKNWGAQNDVSHLSTLVGLYNTYNQLGNAVDAVTTGVNFGGGTMGQVGAGLSVITALQSGNPISIATSGASFYNAMAGTAVIPVPIISVFNIANALQSGDPFAIASSVASMFPPWGTVASVVISIIGGLVPKDIPEPPNGAVHYEWDATGAIQIQTDHDISKGAATATSTAGSVLGLLQSVVTANNATNDTAGQSHNNLGLDPSRLPRIGHTAGTSWMEITHADGTVTKETINPATIGQRRYEEVRLMAHAKRACSHASRKTGGIICPAKGYRSKKSVQARSACSPRALFLQC